VSKSDNPFNRLGPLVWMAAGAFIALLVAAGVVAFLLPDLMQPSEAPLVPSPTATPSATARATAIPTFTSSPTLSPTPTPTPSLTPTPSETPTPPPSGTPTVTPSITPTLPPTAYAARDTRLFLGPGPDYPEQGWLPKGSRALILAQLEDGEWWYLETERGIRGWAEAGDITLENDLSTVPVVTPLPVGAAPAPSTPIPTAAPIVGPLVLDEVWPVQIIACETHFEFDLWIRAHGGTGVYTYLINDQVVAERVTDDGTTARIVQPSGAWVGIISVLSGDLRVDRDMYFAPADWCFGD
jgi:hypothetical protein